MQNKLTFKLYESREAKWAFIYKNVFKLKLTMQTNHNKYGKLFENISTKMNDE